LRVISTAGFAEAVVQLTITHFSAKLAAEDLGFLEKSMRLYGDLRINESLGAKTSQSDGVTVPANAAAKPSQISGDWWPSTAFDKPR
jgi:hypothetical protein